jgi:hypothetical protein
VHENNAGAEQQIIPNTKGMGASKDSPTLHNFKNKDQFSFAYSATKYQYSQKLLLLYHKTNTQEQIYCQIKIFKLIQ